MYKYVWAWVKGTKFAQMFYYITLRNVIVHPFISTYSAGVIPKKMGS